MRLFLIKMNLTFLLSSLQFLWHFTLLFIKTVHILSMIMIKISYDSIFFRFCGLLSVSREVQKAATCIAKKVKMQNAHEIVYSALEISRIMNIWVQIFCSISIDHQHLIPWTGIRSGHCRRKISHLRGCSGNLHGEPGDDHSHHVITIIQHHHRREGLPIYTYVLLFYWL